MTSASAVLLKLQPLDPRIPHWRPEDLQSRACPMCGLKNAAVLRRPDDLPVAHCSACALWYVASMPLPQKLGQFYQEYWNSHRPVTMDAKTAASMTRIARERGPLDIRRNRLGAILGGLEGKRVIDVGCGPGHFMLALRLAGAQAVGVEISSEARAFVKEHLGLPIFETLDEAHAHGSVDAVVLNDVVEHFEHPAEFLRTVVELLRPGGAVAIWTPNGGAAGATLSTAREWLGFRVDLEHLQYYSPESIVVIARKMGLTVEHIETTGFPDFTAIESQPGRESLRGRLRAARTAVSGSPVGSVARAVRRAFPMSGHGPDRTNGTYHLFALLKRT